MTCCTTHDNIGSSQCIHVIHTNWNKAHCLLCASINCTFKTKNVIYKKEKKKKHVTILAESQARFINPFGVPHWLLA